MKAILDTHTNPLRVARGGFAETARPGAGMTRGARQIESQAWSSTLRWARLAMWLLVMVVSVWDIAVTFGVHLAFGRWFP